MSESFQKLFPQAYFARLLDGGLRADGRDKRECRKTRVSRQAVTTADASALCTIGRTSVVCGICLEVGQPHLSRPSEGWVDLELELGGLCAATPNESDHVRCGQLLRRLVNSSVDMESLCLAQASQVWVLKCQLICLDNDGSVADACVLALFDCLQELCIPTDVAVAEDGKVRILSHKRPSKVGLKYEIHAKSVMCLTFGLFEDDHILADPTFAEQEVLKGCMITLVVDQKTGQCLGVSKSAGPSLTCDQLKSCLSLASKRTIVSQST